MLTFCETACSLERNVFFKTVKHFAAPAINLCQRRESLPLAGCGDAAGS